MSGVRNKRKMNIRGTPHNTNFWDVQIKVIANRNYSVKKLFPAWERERTHWAPLASRGEVPLPPPGGQGRRHLEEPRGGVTSSPSRPGRAARRRGTPRRRGGTAAARGGAAPPRTSSAARGGGRGEPSCTGGPDGESRGGTMTQRREPRPAAPLDEELEALG